MTNMNTNIKDGLTMNLTYEDLGKIPITKAGGFNVPINITIDFLEEENMWELKADCLQTDVVRTWSFKARAYDRVALEELVRTYWLPLYQKTTKALEALTSDKDGHSYVGFEFGDETKPVQPPKEACDLTQKESTLLRGLYAMVSSGFHETSVFVWNIAAGHVGMTPEDIHDGIKGLERRGLITWDDRKSIGHVPLYSLTPDGACVVGMLMAQRS
jgi:hypothetical protein